MRRSGLPKIDEIVLQHADGATIAARAQAPLTGDGLRTASGVCIIPAGRFPYCPICLEQTSPADTSEHVPPKAFGGSVMANTCALCNNNLGSRTESAMQDWYDNAVRAHFTSDGGPRPFARDRLLILKTDDDAAVLMLEKASRPGETSLERLKEPNVLMHIEPPRPSEYLTGLLKSAYLAACLHLGGVPDSPTFRQARTELLAARDAESRRAVALGPMASALRVHRTGQPSGGPTLVLLRSEHEDEVTFLLGLAGTLLIEWPFSDVDPMRSPRLQAA